MSGEEERIVRQDVGLWCETHNVVDITDGWWCWCRMTSTHRVLVQVSLIDE